MSGYKIKLEVFEGPMALLMHLIEKNQLDIYDIPIADITEQYLNYLKALKEFNVEIASEFLVMAATLVQIKSRMLLPRTIPVQETEEYDLDPRQELVDRLIEYRKFKQLSDLLSSMAEQRAQFVTRAPQQFANKFLLPEGLSIDKLLLAFAAVWESTIDDYALVAREEISIQDKIQDILHLLYKHKGRIEFSAILTRSGTRSEVVAAFLALLELIKMSRVFIQQDKSFSPIYIMLRGE
ncbi:segregation and condensation protein A [Sporomusaceae bacterium FL31]|nr:segregation and condensation protein A [Sporomusaceae bacterium FL31]GCE33331.1 segregation and condensation protein A [Sporomusaceae bacterium]